MKKTAIFVLVLLLAAVAMPAAAAETEEATGFLQMIVQHLRLRPSSPPVLSAGSTRDFSMRRTTALSGRDALDVPKCRCTNAAGRTFYIYGALADPPECTCCDGCAAHPRAPDCLGF